ncbi:MAG: hypothetical protein JNM39_13760 [Bdellovibrionaceae bacterium]|nr:hypothetical protein [Pseudobdellovibrionaceae bacterium]
MRENIRILEVPTQGASEDIYLVIPRLKVTFEHLMRIYQILQEKLGPLVLIIADRMPPKHRPLLVKFRIPFIYKNESIFVPNLGVKIGNLKKFEDHPKPELAPQKEELTPFALKILAGFLTNQIPQEFTQKSLLETLQDKTKLSASKLSPTLIELTERELLNAHGAGPTKTYTQENHQRVWERLLSLPLAPLFREIEANYLPKPLGEYIVAGEAALASYSNLAHPNKNIIAVTTNEFRLTFQSVSKKSLVQESQITTLVQVWREDPALFAIKGVQNPIEVFFALQKSQDERIQLSLDEMLEKYGLRREKE